MTTFNMPDLGEGLLEAEIVSWHVAVGDRVVADQPLVSVETDKAVVEIPAPSSATVGKLFVEPGTIVAVGDPLVSFEESADDSGTVAGRFAHRGPAEPRRRRGDPSSALEGQGQGDARGARVVPPA